MENYQIRPIEDESDYKLAMVKLQEVWDAKPNTPEGNALELLLLVIEKYEAEHHPMLN